MAQDAGLGTINGLLSLLNAKETSEKQSINTNLSGILEASKYATNQDTISNIVNNWDSLSNASSMYSETEMQHNLIGGIIKDKEAQINQYTKSVNDAENIINDAGFLDKESEFVDLHSNIISIKNDDGSQKYESVMEWVSNEYAKIEGIYNSIGSGIQLGLKRGKGIDDSNILSQIGQYKNRLDGALEALISGDDITPEEARLIIMGDKNTFQRVKEMRTSKEGLIIKGIKEYDSLIEIIDKQVNNISKGVGNDMNNFLSILQSSTSGKEMDNNQIQFVMDSANDAGLFGMDSNGLEVTRDYYIKERNSLIDNYKYWSGSDYIGEFKTADEIGAESFFNYAGGDDDFSETDLVDDESLAEQSFRSGISIEESKKQDIEKENVIKREEIRKETPPKVRGVGVDLLATGTMQRARRFNVHPSLQKEVDERNPRGFGYPSSIDVGEDDWQRKIMDKSNRLKEKDKILDGSDKASPAMNEFLKGNLNMNQAMTKGKYSDSNITEVVGSPSRKKLKAFQNKFKNSGLTIEEFIAQNKEEYYEMTKILKYGDYWFKNPKKIGNSKHYINLYD